MKKIKKGPCFHRAYNLVTSDTITTNLVKLTVSPLKPFSPLGP